MVWIYWLISLTLVTYISAQIVIRFKDYGFAVLCSFYVIYLGASQVLASRFIIFDLGFYRFYAPAAVFIYPFIAQATDMINEVYGRKMAHIAIAIAFATQVLLVTFIVMVRSLTPAPFFEYEKAWQSLFGLSIRITVASWVAFLISSNLDAWIFAALKEKLARFEVLSWKSWPVWFRVTFSDLADLTVDSLVFVPLAFIGVAPIFPLIVGQLISKNIIGFLDNPWFVWYKQMLRKQSPEHKAGIVLSSE